MKAATLKKPAASAAIDGARLRGIALLRIASSTGGTSKSELMLELEPITGPRLGAGRLRALVDSELQALVGDGLAVVHHARFSATARGLAEAEAFVGAGAIAGRPWSELRDVRLIAQSLGLQREPAKRLKALASPEGVRAAILQRAYKLKIKGQPTPSRLREALARVALERAFGNKVGTELGGKSGLSPKAGRLLAAQLARKPRDFGTDARLIAALAAEQVGAGQTDLASLRLALLRSFVATPVKVARPRKPLPKEIAPALQAPVAPEPALATPPGRPDLSGFSQEVRRHAASRAQGWSGDRKAYISQVWHAVRDQRPEWGISEIEFKCMLAEAHRAGELALANADLKDRENMQDLQDSALVFKNAVFHFIRVES